ncbi:terminase [Cronobacter malonaticus]|uniref:terminase n=1 Tax=Cronobacter malonaticus TaxID=413503 RepID=UPI001375F0C3|nr:terminase [Cronobacter malonaticus]NCH03918.1 terminase [Cronobacter malonaticus]NCH53303.1 terminase [Cronobacter malonaticus]
MAKALHDPESLLAEDMGRFFYDPLGWVMYSFEWGRGELTGFDGPDEWQIEFLRDWGEAIKSNNFDGVKPVDAYRCATSSGHGIGKSALTAWLILYIMSTRPQCKGVVTANTSEQLRTKTWGELGKWKKRCITGHWFEYNNGKGNMNIYHVDHMESWRCDGQTCREENSESFAGLHAASSSPFYIFDEASAVPDKIWEVAEGGLTDGEPFWFAFGNPTRNTGRFRECFRKFRHRWRCRQIDSRKAKMTNKELIEQWAKDYGEDSDFFKVRVRGLFPSASDLQFIPQALVDEAMRRYIRPENYQHAPVIIGVDPAYSGSDEACVYLRQGLHSQLLGCYQKTDDDVKFAELIAQFEDKHKADAVFIDFGYGTGIHSVGKSWGRKWRLVQFGGESADPAMLNKRGEIWNSMKKWMEEGGSIDDQQTADELVAPEYKVKLDGKIVLEAKDDMKRRGVPSPNRADALAITFAFPVVKNRPVRRQFANTDYNLFG